MPPNNAVDRHFCSYFDHRYLPQGLALYDSLRKYCCSSHLWVLCLDELCFSALETLDLPGIHPLRLADLERRESDVPSVKPTRTIVEYYFTLTPVLLLHLLETQSEIDRITYVDADMLFMNDANPMFEEISTGSVAVVEHRFPPRLRHHERWGKYNVGLLSFARDRDGLACLRWWRERCLEWCYDRVDGTRFADQGYLDEFPRLFEGVVVLQHKGVNVAPWNIENYRLTNVGSTLYVDDVPLICYHFQGLKRIRSWLYAPNVEAYGHRLDSTARRHLYAPYVLALDRESRLVAARLGPSLQESDDTGSRLVRPSNPQAPSRPEDRGHVATRMTKYGRSAATLARRLITREWLLIYRGEVL
jgi:hypothetical protein